MSESSGKAKEIVLGDELGDIAVRANGIRVEIHTDGSVVAYTKGDVDAYTNGAVHVHPAVNDEGKPAAKDELMPGDKMADGTIYAGTSPDSGKKMYVTPADAPDASAFNEAQKYARTLDAHGHRDWRVPTVGELKTLFNNRAAIGGFEVSDLGVRGCYWASSRFNYFGAWMQRFCDGERIHSLQFIDYKNVDASLRCVR